jgi:hypothetical protein
VVGDLAELAARIGTPMLFARSGKVILYEEFNDANAGSRFIVTGTLTLTNAAWRLAALRQQARTISPFDNIIERRLPSYGAITYGVAYMISFPNAVWVDYECKLNIVSSANNTNLITFGVRISQNNNTIDYWGAGGSWTPTSLSAFRTQNYWERIRLVVNAEDKSYKYIEHNDERQTFVSGITLGEQKAIAAASFCSVIFKLQDVTPGGRFATLDDLVITIEEP